MTFRLAIAHVTAEQEKDHLGLVGCFKMSVDIDKYLRYEEMYS